MKFLGKKKRIIRFVALAILVISIIHLLSTDGKNCYDTTTDDQYEVCFAEYNYSRYLNLYSHQKGKITIDDKFNNTTVHTLYFQPFNSSNVEEIEWSLDSVHLIGRKSYKAFKLPRKISLASISDRYITRVPLVERISNNNDFNKDGITDKYALVSDDEGYYVILFLMQNDGKYREIKSGYIQDEETLQHIHLNNKGEIEVLFNENKRALKWNRIVRLSFNLELNNLIVVDDVIKLNSKKHSNIQTIKPQTIQTPLAEQYDFSMPKELTNIRHDYYYYKNDENLENPPKEYVETLRFLDNINHYSDVVLQPMEYNLSKFVNYHGTYHRDLENDASVTVNEQGTIEINYVRNLTIEGNNAIVSNFSVNGALLNIKNSSIIYISDIEMYHDVDEGSCSAPVIDLSNSSAVNMTHLTLDGSGLAGLEMYNSSASLNFSKVTNCWNSALQLDKKSNLGLYYTIIENNISSSVLDIRRNSKIKLTNCTIRKNTTQNFFEKDNSEIWLDETNIYNNISMDKLTNEKYGNKNFNENSNRFKLFTNINTTLYFFKHLNTESNYARFINKSYIKKQIDASPLTNETVATYNDIAYFAEQHGNYDIAIFLLEKIIEKFPDRTVAYINIGDAYWEIFETNEAKKAYKFYIHKMRQENKEHKIPERVKNRIKTFI